MLRKIAVSSAVFAALGAAPAAFAQTATVLATMWEVRVGASDYMSTVVKSERDAYTNIGQIAYFPSTNISGTAALYRLWNGGSDQMDSVFTSESTYTLVGTLGYPWSSSTAVPGLVGLDRLYNGSDHATLLSGDSLSGYSTSAPLSRYVYPRYKNAATSMNSLTAGGVTIGSNSVSGGALWSWVWNGTEFIDNSDFGRLLQSAMFWYVSGSWHNPTEAGSIYGATTSRPATKAQGSPLLQNSNSGNTQTTRAVPIEWNPDTWGGGEVNPVIYADMVMGKDITLNYNSMGAVAKYVTTVTTASSVSDAFIEAPTGYMPATFNRFYTYDASSQTLTEVFPSSSCSADAPLHYTPPSGYGGVIISNSAQTKAMAVYARTTAVSGPIDYFDIFQWNSCSGPSKWNARVPYGTISAGTHTYNTYITTGTLTGAVANLRQLYVDGAL